MASKLAFDVVNVRKNSFANLSSVPSTFIVQEIPIITSLIGTALTTISEFLIFGAFMFFTVMIWFESLRIPAIPSINALKEGIDFFKDMQKDAKLVKDSINKFLENKFGWLKSIFDFLFDVIKRGIEWVVDKIVTATKRVFDYVVEKVTEQLNYIRKEISFALDLVKTAYTNFLNRVIELKNIFFKDTPFEFDYVKFRDFISKEREGFIDSFLKINERISRFFDFRPFLESIGTFKFIDRLLESATKISEKIGLARIKFNEVGGFRGLISLPLTKGWQSALKLGGRLIAPIEVITNPNSSAFYSLSKISLILVGSFIIEYVGSALLASIGITTAVATSAGVAVTGAGVILGIAAFIISGYIVDKFEQKYGYLDKIIKFLGLENFTPNKISQKLFGMNFWEAVGSSFTWYNRKYKEIFGVGLVDQFFDERSTPSLIEMQRTHGTTITNDKIKGNQYQLPEFFAFEPIRGFSRTVGDAQYKVNTSFKPIIMSEIPNPDGTTTKSYFIDDNYKPIKISKEKIEISKVRYTVSDYLDTNKEIKATVNVSENGNIILSDYVQPTTINLKDVGAITPLRNTTIFPDQFKNNTSIYISTIKPMNVPQYSNVPSYKIMNANTKLNKNNSLKIKT